MLAKLTFSLVYVVLMGVSLLVFRRFRAAAPFYWAIPVQALMALGTIALINDRNPTDVLYVQLYFLALLVFVTVAAIVLSQAKAGALLSAFERLPITADPQGVRTVTVGILVVSVLVTLIYYSLVGYNIVFLLLSGGGVDDYSTLRLAAYSGEDYFAPGYVNQFKNVLLPITAICVGHWLWLSRNRTLAYGYALGMAAFVIVALAGTGQRGFLFYTGAAIGMGMILYWLGRPIRISPVFLGAAAVPVVLLFGLMTASYYEGSDGSALRVASDTLARFTTIQQEGGLVGFHYVHSLPTAWFGEWAQGFLGILPGREGSRLAHEVHALMYGSDRGTVPVTTIGSAYLNAGVFGVILLYAAMAAGYVWAYVSFLRGPRTIVRCVTYGFIFLYLTIWVSDGPVILLDNGVLAGLLFLALVARARRKAVTVPHYQRPAVAASHSDFRDHRP